MGNFSRKHKNNHITADKNRDPKFFQVGSLENESERRGMDVNVKFTFDDSYLGEEEELNLVDVSTGRVPEQGATLDLLERTGNGKSEVTNQLLPSARGNKQPVYFDPQVCTHIF